MGKRWLGECKSEIYTKGITMPVQLKDIDGLMLEKDSGIGHDSVGFGKDARNHAIYSQGLKKIGLNREKLAQHLYVKWFKGNQDNFRHSYLVGEMLLLADTIISNEHELLEYTP